MKRGKRGVSGRKSGGRIARVIRPRARAREEAPTGAADPAVDAPPKEMGTPLKLQTLGRFILRVSNRLRAGKLLDAADLERIDALSAALHGRDAVDFGSLSDGRLAAAFTVAPRTVMNWHHEGLPTNPDRTHALRPCIDWFAARGGDRPGLKGHKETKLEKIRRLRQEHAHREETGKVHDSAQCLRFHRQARVEARLTLESALEREILEQPPEVRPLCRAFADKLIGASLAALEAAETNLLPPPAASAAGPADPESEHE